MFIFAASSGMVMPACPCTSDSACAARVPLPLGRPAAMTFRGRGRRRGFGGAASRASYLFGPTTFFGASHFFGPTRGATRFFGSSRRGGGSGGSGGSGSGGSRSTHLGECRSGVLEAAVLVYRGLKLLQSIGDLSALHVKKVGHSQVLARWVSHAHSEFKVYRMQGSAGRPRVISVPSPGRGSAGLLV